MPQSPKHIKEVLEQAEKAAKAQANDAGSTSGTVHLSEEKPIYRIETVSAADLQAQTFPELHWAVKNLLPEGEAMLAAQPKTGKSWMALSIAISVAQGTMALGCFETNQSDVLYIPYEDGFRRIQDRVNRILEYEDPYTKRKAPKNLHFLKTPKGFPALNDGGLDSINDFVEKNRNTRLIILDTMGRAVKKSGKNGNGFQEDYDIGAQIQTLAIEKHICILLIHHTRKASADSAIAEISGTFGVSAALDVALILKANGDQHELHVTGRDVEMNTYAASFDKNSCLWSVRTQSRADSLNPERKAIYSFMHASQRPVGGTEIAKAVGKSQQTVSKTLKLMVYEGLIRQVSFGKYEVVSSSLSV